MKVYELVKKLKNYIGRKDVFSSVVINGEIITDCSYNPYSKVCYLLVDPDEDDMSVDELFHWLVKDCWQGADVVVHMNKDVFNIYEIDIMDGFQLT